MGDDLDSDLSDIRAAGLKLFAHHSLHKRTLCFCRGNIPGGDVQAGEELCHYLPPFPAKGTGFHRYIYVLFKQDRPINFQGDARPSPW